MAHIVGLQKNLRTYQVWSTLSEAFLTDDEPAWKKALTILGKSEGAKLMALGIYLMLSFGTPWYILNEFGINEPVLALLFVFGILFLVVGFGMYYDDWEKKSGRRARRKAKKSKASSSR
jgi:hypothetical protein